MTFVNEPNNKRTIDHERGAYLHYEGGTMERNIERFSFHWKNDVIEFYAEKELIDNGENELPSVIWHFSRLDFPPGLADSKQAVIDMIRDALEAHGSIYGFKTIKTAEAQYHSPA